MQEVHPREDLSRARIGFTRGVSDQTAPSSTAETLANLLTEDRRVGQRQGGRLRRRPRGPGSFWATQAERLTWATKWYQVLDWSNAPFAKWFVGGTLNAAYNCVDRHVEAGRGDKVAIHWVGEPEGDARDITYAQLKDEVSQAANALTDLGVRAGDRVAIYMPMIPEALVAMLACARIGAPHTVVFGGVLRRRPRLPHRRLPGQGRHHLRRRLPPHRPHRPRDRFRGRT